MSSRGRRGRGRVCCCRGWRCFSAGGSAGGGRGREPARAAPGAASTLPTPTGPRAGGGPPGRRPAGGPAGAASLLGGAADAARDGEGGATDGTGRGGREIAATAELVADVRSAQEAIDLAQDRLSEASRLLASARDRIEADPARLEE